MDIEKKEEPQPKIKQSEDQQKIADRLQSEFSRCQRQRNQAFTYFRNRELTTYLDESSQIINNYQLKPDWKEDWQSNISDSSTHAKFMAILAQMVSMNFRGMYGPHSSADFEAVLMSEIMNDINTYINTIERNGKQDLMFMFLRALRDGTVIGWEGYIDSPLMTGVDSRLVDIRHFYPQHVNKFGLKEQEYVFWEQIMEIDEFKNAFSKKFPLAKDVQPAGNFTSEDTGLFEIVQTIDAKSVRVLRYFNKVENQYHIWANGVLITSPKQKLSDIRPEGAKNLELGFFHGGYEAFDPDFFYCRAFPDILKDNHDAISFLFNAMFDQTLINVMRPLMFGGINETIDDYWGPAKTIAVSDVDQIKWLDSNSLDLTAFRVLKELQDRNTFASIDPTTQGKVSLSSPTATEIERVQEQARKMFVLFNTIMETALVKQTYLRGFTIKEKYLNNPDFQQFILDNVKLLNGKMGTKVVRFVKEVKRNVDQFGFSPELGAENKRIMGESGIIEVQKDKFKNFKFRVKASVDTPLEMSPSLKKAFLDRFTTKAYQMPQIFDPNVVKQIDVENNRDVLGSYAQDLVAPPQSAQDNKLPGSELANELLPTNQAAVPNLKKLINEPI